jgi:hypothetical protein
MGTQAATQSSQPGQLDVAQALHHAPGPHELHSPSHAVAHCPTPNRHTPPSQSACDVHPLGPVVVVLDVVVLDVVVVAP